jgi:sugar-specific transcriptional regulator TrmB
MNIENILKNIGLGEAPIQIYTALLGSAPLSVSAIARKTGLHRPIIYRNIPELIDKGLVNISPKAKKKLYAAEHPDKIKRLISELGGELDKILPELDTIYNGASSRPLVKYLEGKKGMRFVFEDIVHSLKKGDTFYRYSSTKDGKKGPSNLPTNYRTIRDQKKLERFVITSDEGSKYKKQKLERSIKVVPKEFGLFDYDITEIIYGGKVAFIDDNTETAIIIENSTIANFQKKLFKILYSKI